VGIALVAVACIVIGAALCAIWWWVPKFQILQLTTNPPHLGYHRPASMVARTVRVRRRIRLKLPPHSPHKSHAKRSNYRAGR
jgi:hypothetical protein